MFVELVRACGEDPAPHEAAAIGRIAAHIMTMRRMSISVAGMLQDDKDVAVEAALVKELGNNFEKVLPEIARLAAPSGAPSETNVRAFRDHVRRDDAAVALVHAARRHERNIARRDRARAGATLMTEHNETRQLILDTASKIFTDNCDKGLQDAAEEGEFPSALWQLLVENGFNQLGGAGSGTDAVDMYAFIQACGRFAVPLPIADTLLVNSWLGDDTGISSVGLNVDTQIHGALWGRRASRVVGVSQGEQEVVVCAAPALAARGANMAGEPSDTIDLSEVQRVAIDADPFAQVALTRVNLMAGCLQSVLDLGLRFATEREQFGRSISKFQAIQHSLAIVASEVAAAKRAADAAVDALGSARFVFEVAVAKARVGEAAGIVAEQVHQIHGAMGFTHEHRLHHFTRRVWAWRDEWGNEFYWNGVLGAHLASLGADNVWDFIATRS